jgi:hypothetical protein
MTWFLLWLLFVVFLVLFNHGAHRIHTPHPRTKENSHDPKPKAKKKT